jgi:hypothetical protein
MPATVTRESIEALLNDPRGHRFVQHVVGRACVALFKRQTEVEKANTATLEDNGIGFACPDAYQGSLTAKYYMKHGCLQDWQVAQWTKEWRGRPRLCKYHAQLNDEARRRAA